MKRSLTGSLVVCVAAAAFTAGALILNDDSPSPVTVPAATGDATVPVGSGYRGPADAGPATAAPATLQIQGLAFGPVTAAAGGRVVVQNRDGVAHTVTADKGAFDTGIGAKATVNLVAPTAPGSYRFTCLIHPQMSGNVGRPMSVDASPSTSQTAPPPTRSASALIAPALAGGAVAVALGAYGRVHQATFDPIFDLGFPSLQAMKSWLATVAFAFAAFQLVSALGMWGKLPFWRPAPGWLPFAHRWSGTCAFVISLPVAYHCLWALGFQADAGPRVLAHSLLGCAFYGAFSTKLLALRSDRLPKWGLPVVGGTLVVLLTGLWLTSALWFFTTVDFPAFR